MQHNDCKIVEQQKVNDKKLSQFPFNFQTQAPQLNALN